LAFTPVLRWDNAAAAQPSKATGPASRILAFDRDWLFGGKLDPSARTADVDGSELSPVTLPHCVAKLSWQNWDPAVWQDQISLYSQLGQFTKRTPKLDEVMTLDILNATRDARMKAAQA